MSTPLKKILRRIPGIVGVYEFLFSLIKLPRFVQQFRLFAAQSKATTARFPLRALDIFPWLFDATKTTPFDPHYIYHPAWAARVVARLSPKKHVDIASALQFPTIISAFVPVEYYDYRPAALTLSNLESKPGNLTALPFADNSIESLSCMHTIEHVGLGRYGDPIDYDGDIKACGELTRVLAPGGTLIFVTPVGQSRIEYNAHRVYAYEQVLALFPNLRVEEFSMVPDDYETQGLILNADPALVAQQRYGCGCFVFKKPT